MIIDESIVKLFQVGTLVASSSGVPLEAHMCKKHGWGEVEYGKYLLIYQNHVLGQNAASYTQQEVIDLLVKERKRSVDTAHAFWKKYDEKFTAREKLHDNLAFVDKERAEIARYIGNSIEGGNAIADALGYTVEDFIKSEYFGIEKQQL